MSEFFPKIKKDFEAYKKFRLRKKVLERSVLDLTPPPKNTNLHSHKCYGQLNADAGIPNCVCSLQADVVGANRADYSARVFADHFGESPCLRFCPTGRIHVNRDRGKGLKDRPVPTPHFHKVDSYGIMRAYPVQKAKATAAIIGDVQSGINLFCQESKLISPDGSSVVVKVKAEELGLSTPDPSDAIQFL